MKAATNNIVALASVDALAASAARVKATQGKAAAITAPTERLLTLQDCREAARVTRWTLWRWISDEGLRVVRIGGTTRIRQTDWQRFLDSHTGAASNGTEATETTNTR